MVVINVKNGIPADDSRGKFDEPAGYGMAVFGCSRYGDFNPWAGVYQKQLGKKGKILSRHFDNYPTKSNSYGSLRRREMFRNGMLAWKALDTETKREYNSRKYPYSMTGHNRFLKEYLKINH